MHGGKEQQDRLSAMQSFRDGTVNVLVATDVSARGIDIPGVDFVVNYDLPEVPENYVHRVGRTGRGMQKGQAISFCSTEEKEMLQTIEQFLQQPIKTLDIHHNDYSQTINLSDEKHSDWKTLMREIQTSEEKGPKKSKKKKH